MCGRALLRRTCFVGGVLCPSSRYTDAGGLLYHPYAGRTPGGACEINVTSTCAHTAEKGGAANLPLLLLLLPGASELQAGRLLAGAQPIALLQPQHRHRRLKLAAQRVHQLLKPLVLRGVHSRRGGSADWPAGESARGEAGCGAGASAQQLRLTPGRGLRARSLRHAHGILHLSSTSASRFSQRPGARPCPAPPTAAGQAPGPCCLLCPILSALTCGSASGYSLTSSSSAAMALSARAVKRSGCRRCSCRHTCGGAPHAPPHARTSTCARPHRSAPASRLRLLACAGGCAEAGRNPPHLGTA